MRLGLFGGSFNPPHVGHLVIAEAMREAAGLDRIVWMPAARPPHKVGQDLAPPEARLALVRAAIAGNDAFDASDLELRRAADTGAPSYTVDTLRTLTDTYRGAAWHLLMGEDSYAALGTWREPDAIVALARLVVYRRAGAPPHDAAHAARFPAVWADAPRLDVSSTEVRARLAAGRTVRYLVPDAVRAALAAHGLYRGT